MLNIFRSKFTYMALIPITKAQHDRWSVRVYATGEGRLVSNRHNLEYWHFRNFITFPHWIWMNFLVIVVVYDQKKEKFIQDQHTYDTRWWPPIFPIESLICNLRLNLLTVYEFVLDFNSIAKSTHTQTHEIKVNKKLAFCCCWYFVYVYSLRITAHKKK